MSYIIGLTGSTGSGKSSIAAELAKRGAHVIDADEIARRLQQPGQAGARAIEREFGSEYFDPSGRLQRDKLAGLVFNNPAELDRLNRTMFPLITAAIQAVLQRLDGVCVLDAAVLYEAGGDKLCDMVISATADEGVRRERIMRRDGLSQAQAEQRMAAQRQHYPGDYVLDTTQGLASLEAELDGIYAKANDEYKEGERQ